MKTISAEFAPLERERAEELNEIINQGGAQRQAVVIGPDDQGITGCSSTEIISSNESTNALVRYRRHY